MSNASDLGILFLHALPLDGSMWRSQMAILPGRTHAPTLYSFGTTLTEWAAKALAEARHDRLILVGCSVGGSCALEVAKLAPDRVAALVLIGTKPKHRPQPDLRTEALTMIANKGLAAAWEKYWVPLFSQNTERSIVQNARDSMLRLPPRHIANGVSVFHTRESRDLFVSECNIPITVVTGEDDVVPGIKLSGQVAASAKQGSLHVIPSCGHYVSLEQPEALREILLDVIDSTA
ncbi:MAG TPA: hypothetical protein DD437_07175 [Rhodobiaceae bacterium]|nr:hypothetical protein [Rhodobiaceae bacterium]